MDIFIAVLLIILLAMQGLNYYSLAYIYTWLRARVITPTIVDQEEDPKSPPEDEGENSRGMYL